jgi:hypothetical protein
VIRKQQNRYKTMIPLKFEIRNTPAEGSEKPELPRRQKRIAPISVVKICIPQTLFNDLIQYI